MTVDERRKHIEQRLHAMGELSYLTLAQELDVSEMTIRRDIEALEALGRVRRVLGGAIAFTGKAEEPSLESRLVQAANEKRHIAEAVVALFEPRETVALDGGSTVLAVARSIRAANLALTVITPSMLAATELAAASDPTVFLTGGRLRSGELSLIGAEAERSLGRYNCDTYVMGIAGVSGTRGFTDYHSEESAVKRVAIEFADRVIVPVDSSKLGKVNLIHVAPLTSASVIVTDGQADHPTLEAARHAGVTVVLC